MKIAGYVRYHWDSKRGVAFIKPSDADAPLFQRMMEKKSSRQEKHNQEILVLATMDLQFEKRTQKQLNTAWRLIEIIFESQEGRRPTEEEKYSTYEDFLFEFGTRVPSKINPAKTRPVRLSESNTYEAAVFVQALMDWLAKECNLPLDLQADVRTLMYAWEAYRGTLEKDPLDYAGPEMVESLTVKEWRKRHVVSDASGIGGNLELAHIVSRGSDHEDIEEPWNFLALLPEEHRYQHAHGWEPFLEMWPHLRGRVVRARETAGKLPLEMKRGNYHVQSN